MRHIGKVSIVRDGVSGGGAGMEPNVADAKTEFMNAVWRAWSDFVYQKKNEMAVS